MTDLSALSARSPLSDPLRTALRGIGAAQAQAEDASARLAGGPADPAVVLDLSQAGLTVAANVAVAKTAEKANRQLLDILA